MPEIRCSVCGTSFQMGDDSNHPLSQLRDGIHYLVPETIRNENVTSQDRVAARLDLLKAAGINVDRMRELLNGSDSFRDIFETDDPIINELCNGGFLRNPELFRRWITVQTFRLLKDTQGWTHAVRRAHDIRYVLSQTMSELTVLCHLQDKCPNDIRFQFFTLDDMKRIFFQLSKYNKFIPESDKQDWKDRIFSASSYKDLADKLDGISWGFKKRDYGFIPRDWLNCYKGAGAYYTLMNIIYTHEMVLPDCTDMDTSLERVNKVFKDIVDYEPCQRRWDIMLSLLTKAVAETHFELTW